MIDIIINRLQIHSNNYEEIVNFIAPGYYFEFDRIVEKPIEIMNLMSKDITDDALKVFILKIKDTPLIKKYIEKIIQHRMTDYLTVSNNTYKYYLEKCLHYTDFENKPVFKDEESVLNYGELVMDTLVKYDVISNRDWEFKYWGAIGGARVKKIDENIIYFTTEYTPIPELISKLSEIFPDAKFEYDFAAEDISYSCGEFSFEKGQMTDKKIYDSETREAYEKGFELFPDSRDYFKFDNKTNNYYHISDEEMQEIFKKKYSKQKKNEMEM